ncbi:MAG: hypothetical protein H5T64_10780 [Chloroflexi bacterium]|nr:hypothetical protein [Chloroflexota bacterium]
MSIIRKKEIRDSPIRAGRRRAQMCLPGMTSIASEGVRVAQTSGAGREAGPFSAGQVPIPALGEAGD